MRLAVEELVREVAAGSARECLVAAAWLCESGDLHDLRLDVLPNVQRRVAQVERNLGSGPLAVNPGDDAETGPATDALLDPADRPLFATATRATETYQPRAG
mgnify:CR=1 FL=1